MGFLDSDGGSFSAKQDKKEGNKRVFDELFDALESNAAISDITKDDLELVNGKPYQFEEAGALWVGFYNSNDRLFYDSKCFNESITDSKNCINIQSLTVGGK